MTMTVPTIQTSPLPGRPRRSTPRKLRVMTFDDWMSLAGSLLSSLALVDIVYEHLLDGSGTVGFLVVWYVTFLVLYATVISMSNPRTLVIDRLVTAALYAAGGLVMFALGTAVVFTFIKGVHALAHLNFFTKDMAGVNLNAPLNQGGILAAIVGTFIEVGIAIVVCVPLGIGTAVYMSEVGGRLSKLVRTVVEAMTALPEILAGLFVYVTLIVGFGLPKSGLAASAAMSVTMVPIIARAAEVALRVVPSGLREASLALGASQWRTVRKVVLPSAQAGLATATILGVARGVGETAIVLITSTSSSFLSFNPLQGVNSLPLFTYTAEATGQPNAIARAFGAASVLLVIVLVLFVLLRIFARDKSVQR
jgi:phosphate transport system permease protein